ncbi:YHS domain-containing (seleno)protein [Frigidibacter mobilis]|uniref:YHS domain-containing protein n=1 Tax=Frigidibacter mobilis TaxID=1335048 RepID=A0A159Z6G6_9RHOB|nr:YHS domain-containing (seleno)protein [Frigidibacter mobilis]AMY70090.1 YHS domain-containing protein [Frigidibacter mobilis]
MLPRRPFPALTRRAAMLLVALFCGVAAPALADEQPMATASGVALAGRDAVAYFVEGRAVAGSADHALKWRGAVWFFASGKNLSSFEMNPLAYAPRYGGHCPESVIAGDPRPGNPELFVIREGKLYLARSREALDRILHDPGIVAQADAAWKKLRER